MTSIAPAPTFNVPSRDQMLRTAFSMPFSPLREFWEQAQQSALTSPGLGTALRTLITPPSNTPPPVTTGYGPAADLLASPVNAIRSARYLLQGVLGRQPSLSPEQWQASPYYRKAIPYDPGMTEERAASLAWQHDLEQARAFMSDKQAWTGPFGVRLPSPISFAGQFAGGMLDPVNYLPIFGQGARAVAVARFGVNGLARFGIELSVDAAEAAANSAVFMGLTAQERAKFGDDVSWQAQINNVAMSALIGAVMFPVGRMFGAALWGSKAAANMAAERIAARNFKVPDVETARALMNDVVGSLVETGTPSVSRVTQSVVDKLVDKVAAESARGNPLRRLMAADAGAAPAVEGVPKVGGRWPTEAVSPSGARVQVRPEVVELDSLQFATGENQVRDTNRAANEAWRHETAATLDPPRLMPSIEGDRGAPLVNLEDTIVGGNHRTDAIKLAYQAYPDSAAKYRKAIEDAGFSTDGMQKPVLINRIVTNMSPEETSAFAADLNTSATQRMSSTETAAMDRAALDDSTLKVLADGPIDSAANRAFVATFLGNLPRAERGALVEKDGTLNADGKRRIENALVADAYGDVDATVLRRFSESIDDNTRSVVGAMADVAGRWSLMRRAMKRGEIGAEFDTTAELTQALRSLAGWREDASAQKRPVSTVIKEGMAQLDMLGGGMSDEARAFVRMFYKTDEFSQSAGRDVIAGRLQKVVDSAEELGRPQLFDDGAAATKLGVLKNALNDEQGFIFADDGAGSSDGSGGQGRGADTAGTDRGVAAQEAVAGTGHRSVAERISERVVAAGRPEAEGKAIGQIVEAFYTTQAQRLGVPLAEFEAMFPLPEVRGPGGPVPDAAMMQPPVNSPEFKAWFGDSKVVDDSGRPLVAYHSTAVWEKDGKKLGDIESFDRRASVTVVGRQPSMDTVGSWFGVYDDVAKNAHAYGGSGGTVYPVFLSIKNPWKPKSFKEFIDKMHWAAGRETPKEKPGLGHTVGLRSWLQKQGYDGIVFPKDSVDMPGQTVWVALESEQIKSVYNRGTFDPRDSRILYQGGAAEQGNLFVVHNLSAAGVMHAAKMGGLSMPSLAVARIDKGGFDSFGEISLLARPGMIDPSVDPKAKTVAGDQYSPRYPTVKYKVNDKAFNALSRDALAAAKQVMASADERDGVNLDRLEQRGAGAGSDAGDTLGMLALYYREKGLALPDLAGERSTYGAKEKLLQGVDRGDFQTWAAEKLAPLVKRERIFKGFTYSGNRRYVEHTIENVYADMKSRLKEGEGYNYGVASVRARWAKVLKGIPGIQKARGQIVDKASMEAVKKSFADRMMELLGELQPYYRFDKSNSFTYMDDASGVLAEMGQRNGWRAFSEAFADVPADIREKLMTFLGDLSAAPTEYFETKINRIVGLGEFDTALVPTSAPANVVKALQDAGLRIATYDKSTPGARAEAIKAIDAQRAATGGEPRLLFQPTDEQRPTDMSTARGAIELPEGTGPVIHILQGADASTALHEMGHYFLHILKQMGDQDTAPFALKRDVETLKGWWADVADEVAADSPHDGVTADDVRAVLRDGTTGDRVKDLAIDVGFQEQWARAFEAYLRDGEAPTPGLRGLFEQFKAWLVDVYKRVTDLRVKLSPEVKGVMDRMLGGEDVSTRPGDMRTAGNPAESVAQGNSPEIADSSQPALDFPMPEPPKPMEGAAAAEARLSTGSEDGAALREQFGLDESGGFAEQADIDLLEKQGLLSADDKAALKAADDEIAAAESWGDALMTAARCAFRF